MLGNETRREILQLLSERPCYVSELSQELKIGQKAIIEHLELMSDAGILVSKVKKIEKGRPRKYYLIHKDLLFEVRIGQDSFNVETLPLEPNEKVLELFPRLKKLHERIDKVSVLPSEDRLRELEKIYSELEEEKRNINEARKITEYLLTETHSDIKRLKHEIVFF